jgi:hypothetical protein
MPKRRPRIRRFPHGDLDVMAAALLASDRALTRAEIAEKLGCSAKGLMNKSKYPLLNRLWEGIKAGKWDWHDGTTRFDRRRNGRSLPGRGRGTEGLDSSG